MSNAFTISTKNMSEMVALSKVNYDILVQLVNEVIGNGGPSGVFETLQDLNDLYPKGAKGVYLVTVNGKWYYWNGAEWAAGGVYQATQLSDGSVTEVKLEIGLQDKINSIEGIGEEAEKANVDLASHKGSAQAHNASAITYGGNVPGATNTKQALDSLQAQVISEGQRISTIISNNGDGKKDNELLDMRTPDPIYSPEHKISAAGDLMRDMQKQLVQLSINISSIERLAPEVDDTGRIQRAIDKASLLGIEKVLLLNETYIVSSTIHMKSNVSLIGGYGTVVKVSDLCTGFYSMFSIKSVQNVSISGIRFDGNYDRTNYDISNLLKPEIAVYIVDSKNVRITDNHFKTCGIWTISCEVSASLPYNDEIYIERNIINYKVGKNSKTPDVTGWTVDTTQMYIDAKNYWIEKNIIMTEGTNAETAIEAHRRNGFVSENIINGFRHGVLIVPGFFAEDYESTNINVTNNNFYNVKNGITLWQVSARDLDKVKITENTIEPNPARFTNVESSKGITVLDTLPSNNGGKKVKNVQISKNIIKFAPFNATYTNASYVLNFAGIHLRSWVALENIIVEDNQIIDAPATGIIIGNSSDSTYVNKSVDIVVENNTIINAGINENIASQSFNPRCAIRINGGTGSDVERAMVQNNKIIDNKPSGTYFTSPIYSVAYNVNSCIIHNNPILANGYTNINTPKNYAVPWKWDSQVGAPTLTSSSKYIKNEFSVKLMAHLEITSMAGFTQGFGSYITLPIAPKETRNIPIVITNNTANVLRTWYLEVVNGNANAYIRGLNSDNTIASFTQSSVQVGTKVSIFCEYIA